MTRLVCMFGGTLPARSGLDPRCQAALELHADKAGLDIEWVDTSASLQIYADELEKRWHGTEDLFLVEQDKEVHAGCFPSMLGCDQLWCGMTYWILPVPHTVLAFGGFGVTRFSAEVQQLIPVSAFRGEGQVGIDRRFNDQLLQNHGHRLSRSVMHIHGHVVHHHQYEPRPPVERDYAAQLTSRRDLPPGAYPDPPDPALLPGSYWLNGVHHETESGMTVTADGLTWTAGGGGTDDHLAYQPHEAIFEPLLRALLPPGGVFLDVGAHVGRWTVRLAGQAGSVIAVEANPETALTLQANIDANHVGNVTVYNVAAWDSYTSLSLADPNHKQRGGSTRTLPDDDGLIPGMPLDGLLTGASRVDLVKLDVEGADLHALRGMRGLLNRCHPVLFIEDHSGLGYYPFDDLDALLGQMGYDWQFTPMAYMSARYLVARPRA